MSLLQIYKFKCFYQFVNKTKISAIEKAQMYKMLFILFKNKMTH